MANYDAAVYVGTMYPTLAGAVGILATTLRAIATGSTIRVCEVIPISGGRGFQPYVIYG